MTADWLAGRWIRQYQLLEPLGGGSFGTVYRARHRDLKIDRAFKVLSEALSQDPEVRARFVQEAQTAAHLRHPNIVPVYDVFEPPSGRSSRSALRELAASRRPHRRRRGDVRRREPVHRQRSLRHGPERP